MSAMMIIGLRRAEQRIVDHLTKAGATSASTAQPLAIQGGLETRRLGHLQRAGAVLDAGDHRYYLVPDAYASYRNRRRVLVTILLAVAIGIGLWLWSHGR